MWALVSQNPGVATHSGVAVRIGSKWSVRCEQEVAVSVCCSRVGGGGKANLIKVNVILVNAV